MTSCRAALISRFLTPRVLLSTMVECSISPLFVLPHKYWHCIKGMFATTEVPTNHIYPDFVLSSQAYHPRSCLVG